MQELSEFADPGDIEQLNALPEQIQDYVREIASQQRLEQTRRGYQLTPKRIDSFRASCWNGSSSELAPSRTGRHQGPVVGEGAVELQHTKPYEFGDSVTQMDIPATLTNAMIRSGAKLPDPACDPKTSRSIARATRPSAPTVVLMDMSGSMRYGGLYVNVNADGAGTRRPDTPRISRRFPAVHRDVHLRQTVPGGRHRHAVAEDGPRSSIPTCGFASTWGGRTLAKRKSTSTSQTFNMRWRCRASSWLCSRRRTGK